MKDEEDENELKCPLCGKIFNFKSLSKNEWIVELDYLLVRCPLCTECFKVLNAD